ncbi:MAG: hypothetical protein QG646_4319 [Euryarchaeota archaeon]|nr:hypothetical protein [Euryarchaeota archaeon]
MTYTVILLILFIIQMALRFFLKKMDSASVDNIVLFGLFVTKLWTDFDRERPTYYDDNDAPVYYYSFTDVILAEAIKNLPKEQRDRIYPMICGFNPVDKNGLDRIKRMVEMSLIYGLELVKFFQA